MAPYTLLLRLSLQYNNANPVPCRGLHAIRRRALHRNDSQIARIELEVTLDVLPDKDRAAVREPELVRRPSAAAVAFNDYGTLENGVAVFRESAFQERLSRRREFFLPIRS